MGVTGHKEAAAAARKKWQDAGGNKDPHNPLFQDYLFARWLAGVACGLPGRPDLPIEK